MMFACRQKEAILFWGYLRNALNIFFSCRPCYDDIHNSEQLIAYTNRGLPRRRKFYITRQKFDFVIRVYVCHHFEVWSPILSLRFT
jgi:hypothetical protein